MAEDPTRLLTGRQIGAYRILSLLGAGGMGEVYRARDLKLGRDVAIKVLPSTVAANPDRLRWFEREARLLAALNHPHIAAIYGLEDSDGVRALVLELVEGPTLADRVASGPMPVKESSTIARQVAEALEAAHEKGIIHHDLKPANIKLTVDGNVKVLDFGLAKALTGDESGPALSHLPTMTATELRPGAIVGTLAYMSPEQARGKAVDKRTDIWAFGCVLYEMLTGRAAFARETASDTIGAILELEPEWRALPPIAPSLRRLLQRCLDKDPKHRLRDIGDARIEIDEAPGGPQSDGQLAQPDLPDRHRLAWGSALAVVLLIAATTIALMNRPRPQALEMRLDIATPPTTDPASLAISPDGQKLVFVATSDGRPRLWLRALDSPSARPLAGTDQAQYPFWSPESRSVGFFAQGTLKRIDIDGGPVQSLADSPAGRGGTWSRDGTILFSPQLVGALFSVSAAGGAPVAVTSLAPQQTSHRFPQFLPDGRHFVYYAFGTPEVRGVYVGQTDGSTTRRLLDTDTAATFAPSGHLLFVRQGTLFAQEFDPVRLVLGGTPLVVAEDVAVDANFGALSTSAAGPIVYRTGSTHGQRLVWFDRSGRELARVGEAEAAGSLNPALSPDDRRLAVQRAVDGSTDVWLAELERRVFTRFTVDRAADGSPIWSPDGDRLVFSSNRSGMFDLYQKAVTGAGSEELLLSTEQVKVATDWSLDGRFLLYRIIDPRKGFDLWALPMTGDRTPFPVVQTDFQEREGQFSPDARWIAYESDESGRFEIYVQPFSALAGKSQISTNGGAQVRWRSDGKELFYVALDGRLMAVPIQLSSGAQTVEASAPVPLFATSVVGGAVQPGSSRQQYVVSRDGQRFLVNTSSQEAATPITVLLNWKPKS